jgi:hypothetical protein
MTDTAAVIWFKRDLPCATTAPWPKRCALAARPGAFWHASCSISSLASTGAAAKEKLYGLRQTREAHAEANAIALQHGARRSGLPPTAPTKRSSRAAPDGQGRLFKARVLYPPIASSRGRRDDGSRHEKGN